MSRALLRHNLESNMPQPVMLIIRDGWGINPHGSEFAKADGNATLLAQTPFHDRLYQDYPWSRLSASGMDVGLPEGQMGNSEVGHLNLGAGRIVYQDFTRINKAIAEGELAKNPAINEAFDRAKHSRLHFLGLVSDGGVHSHQNHLIALVKEAADRGVKDILIHAITDGRDTSPTGGAEYVSTVEKTVSPCGATIATVVGRYYAMDRDQRWERTKLAYDAMVRGIGVEVPDPITAIKQAYAAGETDEFVKPRVITGAPLIREGDGIFCFNYRADRMRQIVRALAVPDFDGFDVSGRPSVRLVTMTRYDQQLPFPAAFEPIVLSRIVAEVLSDHGKTMFRTAETEKYAHVTYFFNGGYEPPYKGEERLLVPSQKVATYDLMPEMSAPGVTDVLCNAIAQKQHDFILCNYANGDMVGHSGVLAAAVKAVEMVDQCLARVLTTAETAGATVLVTADHGNCELMIDPATGGPHTAHTTNPVPLVMVGDGAPRRHLRTGGSLRDVGPTILRLLDIEPPQEITGKDLRET